MRRLHAMPRTMRGQIETTIANTEATDKLRDAGPPDYGAAQAKMVELNRKGRLNDSTVNRFAVNREQSRSNPASRLVATPRARANQAR